MSDAPPPNSVAEWLRGKSLLELERIELGGRICYPDAVKRRGAADMDKVQEDPVFIRVPNPIETADAKLAAISWVANRARDKEIKTEDQARARMGESVWSDVDRYHIVAAALLKRGPDGKPGGQYMLAEFLMETAARGSVMDLWDRITFYNSIEDPRVVELSASEVEAVVKTIASKGNLSPLVALHGDMREPFVLSMALRLALSLTPNSQ